jgi:hypothetical protein
MVQQFADKYEYSSSRGRVHQVRRPTPPRARQRPVGFAKDVCCGAQFPAEAPRLVTATQRGYSFGLLLYGTKFATRRCLKCFARPTYAFREAVSNCRRKSLN